MAPKTKKNADSKKSQQKKKEKVIEDRTFGLKNKNKSKVVQQKIQAIERNVHNSGDPKQRKMEEQRKKTKADAKARRKAAEDERNALFGEALLAVQKKGSSTSKKAGAVEAKGRDHDADEKKGGTSRAMKMMYQMDAQEMEQRLREDPNYVPTLEDKIEAERQAKVAELKQSGNPGTPVTEETFKAWQERKRKAKADAAKKLVEAELKKKKGGKGLGVLSGKDLYEYKKELFKDDEEETDNGNGESTDGDVQKVAAQVESDLFLEGDDDDLDDIEDD